MKPRLDSTSAGVDNFSGPQVRRLLILASGSSSRLDELHDIDEARRLLAGLCAAQGEADEDLLGIAATPSTPITKLRRIKSLAKRLLDGAPGAAEAAAARLLYHVAVAAAFGRLGLDISSRPLEQRRLMYERLALDFAGHPIGDVFRRAADRTSST